MTIIAEYYAVTVNTHPFAAEEERFVGHYATKSMAESVNNIIKLTFPASLPQGIRTFIHHVRHYHRDPMALQKTQEEAATTICSDLSMTESIHTIKNVFALLEPKLVKLHTSPPLVEVPKRIYEGHYHCVVLNFEPFDRQHTIYLGYYRVIETARHISDYIKQIHCNPEVRVAFDVGIATHEGKFVEYESGKYYIKVRGEDHEILPSYDTHELLRVSTLASEAIRKYS